MSHTEDSEDNEDLPDLPYQATRSLNEQMSPERVLSVGRGRGGMFTVQNGDRGRARGIGTSTRRGRGAQRVRGTATNRGAERGRAGDWIGFPRNMRETNESEVEGAEVVDEDRGNVVGGRFGGTDRERESGNRARLSSDENIGRGREAGNGGRGRGRVVAENEDNVGDEEETNVEGSATVNRSLGGRRSGRGRDEDEWMASVIRSLGGRGRGVAAGNGGRETQNRGRGREVEAVNRGRGREVETVNRGRGREVETVNRGRGREVETENRGRGREVTEIEDQDGDDMDEEDEENNNDNSRSKTRPEMLVPGKSFYIQGLLHSYCTTRK
jgi:hypothetical protein